MKMKELGIFNTPVYVRGCVIGHQWGDYAKFPSRDQAKAAAHAINTHDDLETDRNNAINQMSKSWKHTSDKESDVLTRYVTMAENQFEVKNQRIADLERQLKAEREINDRLRVVETERAVRNDELYEALLDISHHGVMGGKSMLRIARETLEKHKDEYGERPLKYIAIQYSRGVYGSLFDSEQEAREEHPYADEIIPIRVSGDCDDSH